MMISRSFLGIYCIFKPNFSFSKFSLSASYFFPGILVLLSASYIWVRLIFWGGGLLLIVLFARIYGDGNDCAETNMAK